MPRSPVATSPSEAPGACVLVRGGGGGAECRRGGSSKEGLSTLSCALSCLLLPTPSPAFPWHSSWHFMIFLTSPLDKEFFMMLCCLPYTTFVHYGTCPFCTYQYSGFNRIAALRLSGKAGKEKQSLSACAFSGSLLYCHLYSSISICLPKMCTLVQHQNLTWHPACYPI